MLVTVFGNVLDAYLGKEGKKQEKLNWMHVTVFGNVLDAYLGKEGKKQEKLKELQAKIFSDFRTLSADQAMPEQMSWLNQDSRSRRSTFGGMTWEWAEGGRWQSHCASTPRSCRSTFARIGWERVEDGRIRDTVRQHHAQIAQPSRELGGRGWRAGAGRDIARARQPSKTLRVNTRSMSLGLGSNDLGEGGGRALAETLRDSLLNKALLRMFSFNLSLPAFSCVSALTACHRTTPWTLFMRELPLALHLRPWRAFIAAETPPAPQCTSQAPHRL